MKKNEGIGNEDGSPPTLNQFKAFVRQITSVPKTKVDAITPKPRKRAKPKSKK